MDQLNKKKKTKPRVTKYFELICPKILFRF